MSLERKINFMKVLNFLQKVIFTSNFPLVLAGGLSLCSSKLYLSRTFGISSEIKYRNQVLFFITSKWKQEEGKYGIAKMEDDFCIVMASIILKMAIYPQIQQRRQYIS